MKRLILAIIAAVLIASPAMASDEVLTVVNRTGYTINEIYMSPAAASDWEEDLLGNSTLGSGKQWRIDFSRSANTCIWDMRIVYADGFVYDWGGLDLCTFATVIVTYNESTGDTYVETR